MAPMVARSNTARDTRVNSPTCYQDLQKPETTDKLTGSRSDDRNLLEQCKEVTDIWRLFSQKSSGKKILQRAGAAIVDARSPPSIDTLYLAMKSLEKKRDDGAKTMWGTTKANMHAFANTMNAHKALLSVFPSESIYTSVLSGVASTVILVRVSNSQLWVNASVVDIRSAGVRESQKSC